MALPAPAWDMLKSDWDRWLIDAVEAAEPAGVAVWYLGCNGFILKASDGTTLFVDPYLGLGDPPRTVRMIPVPFDPAAPTDADAVVVTHEHTDHLHGPSQGPLLAETDARLVASEGCIDIASDRGWPSSYELADPFKAVEPGDTLEIGEIELTVYPGTDPDADADLTFVFEHDDHTIVHPGDGRPSDTLTAIGEQFDVDLAIAAVGSSGMIDDKETREPVLTTWYNTPDDCVRVGHQLQAEVLVPTHWDMWKGLTTDPHVVDTHRRSFEHPKRVAVMEIGDRFDLDGR